MEPRYDLSPCGEVELYRGPAHLMRDGGSGEGEAVITFNSDAVRLRTPLWAATTDGATVHIPALGVSVDLLVTKTGTQGTEGLVGAVDFGADRVEKMDYQVLNMPHLYGRLTLQAHGWNVEIRPIENARDRLDELKRRGDVAVTGVGVVTHDDGAFAPNDGMELLQAITWLLSFGFGDRAPVALPVGTDRAGQVVWRRWDAPIVEPYRGRLRWCSLHDIQELASVFPRTLDLWFGGEPWGRDGLWVPLQLYLAAARGLVEPRIVMAHAAVEHLAWRRLVLERQVVSRKEFRHLSGAGRIRKLLELCGVAGQTPANVMTAVDALPGAEDVDDGPDAVTWVRNSIVHARRVDLLLESEADYGMPVLQLLMWYFDMAMLHLLDFEGAYLDRRRGGVWEGDVSTPPWTEHVPPGA